MCKVQVMMSQTRVSSLVIEPDRCKVYKGGKQERTTMPQKNRGKEGLEDYSKSVA